MVVTLLVVPAMGASTAVTEPLPLARPERGSGLASVCWGWLGWDRPWAWAGRGAAGMVPWFGNNPRVTGRQRTLWTPYPHDTGMARTQESRNDAAVTRRH